MPAKKKQKIEENGPTWEWLDGDGDWNAYASKDSTLLEKGYSNGSTTVLTTKGLTFNEGYDTIYTFDFVKMTQTNGSSKTVRDIRRLAASGEYEWEWKDDAGLYVPFYDEDTTLIQKLSLDAGTSGKEVTTKALSFNKGYGSLYAFKFSTPKDPSSCSLEGTQTNKESGTVREIRRIKKKAAWEMKGYGIAAEKTPPKIALASESTEGKKSKKEAAAAAAAAPSGGSKSASGALPLGVTALSLPPNWTSAGTTGVTAATLSSFTEEDVSLTSSEGKEIQAFLSQHSSKTVKVTSLVRIQNPTLYTFFALNRAHVAKRNDGNPNEQRLFFGDHNLTNMKTICKLGYDTRTAANGANGQGLYFYHDVAEVAPRCRKVGGKSEVIITRVSVGSAAKGTSGIRRPPPKDASKPSGDIHDSCVDDEKSPSKTILFNNTQMYPEYIATVSLS